MYPPTPFDAVSERDAAWLEEAGEAVSLGRTALREPPACDAALALLAATDTGAASEPVVKLLLATDPRPDVAATALLLTALARSGYAVRQRCYDTVHDAIQFLLAAQNRDGGWPALAHSPKADPSCPTVSASVLEALGHFGFRLGQPPVDAAVQFVLARQAESGAWLNGTQATWQAVAGLIAVGLDMFALPVRRAVRWLKESQNEDAGWGGPTASDTACALLALLAAGEGESAEVRAGAEYLVGTQHADGTWTGEFADTAFALVALGRYLNERTAPAVSRKALVRTDPGRPVRGPKSYRHTLAEM